MSLLVVGSVAIDTVETPAGKAEAALGGSASYFSYAASFFSPVRLVGVVGKDFPEEWQNVLAERDIDMSGLHIADGETFQWRGRYEGDMNEAETLDVQLNVFGDFEPKVPDHFQDSKFVFLANAGPSVQMKVLEQVPKPSLVVADTMNLWISTARDDLLELMKKVDGLVLNDQEALQLTDQTQLVRAAHKILEMGPQFVIIKKGEHGAMFANAEGLFTLPAFPTTRLVDPTGAGDSFAGGVMGYLAEQGTFDTNHMKRAMAFGSVVASINVEDFSLRRFRETARQDIDSRFEDYRRMLHID